MSSVVSRSGPVSDRAPARVTVDIVTRRPRERSECPLSGGVASRNRSARMWHDRARCRRSRCPRRSWPARSSGAWRGTSGGSPASSTGASSCRSPRASSSSSRSRPILITLLEKPLTVGSLFDSFNWGIATVLGQGDAGVRDLARRTRRRLVAYPVRGRHARHDHRRPRRDGHRFPAQGGSGLGCVGPQGPHRRVRLEQHRPRPDRRAQGRRLQAEGRRPRRRSTRTRPVPASTSSAATRPTPRTSSGPASRTPRRRSSSRPTARTRPTCTRSWRSWPSSRSRRRSAPWPRSTTRTTSRISGGPSVDELLVTSKVASHLLARSALYPGLSGLVTDIVSGGEGSELYRITLPDEYIGLSIDTVVGAAARRPQGDAAVGQPRRPRLRQPARPTSSSRPATTRSSWPRRSARSRRSRCTTSTPPR